MKKLLPLILIFISVATYGQQSRTAARALQLSDSLYLQIASGADFKALAKQFSDDPGSKDNGGVYENVKYGSFVPEFEQVAQQLKPGEISKPFKTQYGYHILQVIKKSETEVTLRHILVSFQE